MLLEAPRWGARDLAWPTDLQTARCALETGVARSLWVKGRDARQLRRLSLVPMLGRGWATRELNVGILQIAVEHPTRVGKASPVITTAPATP